MPKKKYIKFSQVVKQNRKALKRATMRNAGARKSKVLISVAAIVVIVAAAFVTLNENVLKIEKLPTWSSIFVYFGLNEPAVVVLPENDISVHFIDVGQGDSQLIITPGFNILIDSGEKEYYPKVLSYLSKYNVGILHYVIATHPHSDHIGGLSAILTSVRTEKVIMPDVSDDITPTTSGYLKLLEAISHSGAEVIYAESGNRIELGDGAFLDIIAPLTDYGDLNNYSVVCKLTHGKNTFLFTGDIEKESEKDILESGVDISADVLKVAHHGSRTSSRTEFLKTVGGRYAVIGIGMPNSYNHPNENTVENLQLFGYEIYRTDLNGDIVFISDGENLEIITEKSAEE